MPLDCVRPMLLHWLQAVCIPITVNAGILGQRIHNNANRRPAQCCIDAVMPHAVLAHFLLIAHTCRASSDGPVLRMGCADVEVRLLEVQQHMKRVYAKALQSTLDISCFFTSSGWVLSTTPRWHEA